MTQDKVLGFSALMFLRARARRSSHRTREHSIPSRTLFATLSSLRRRGRLRNTWGTCLSRVAPRTGPPPPGALRPSARLPSPRGCIRCCRGSAPSAIATAGRRCRRRPSRCRGDQFPDSVTFSVTRRNPDRLCEHRALIDVGPSSARSVEAESSPEWPQCWVLAAVARP